MTAHFWNPPHLIPLAKVHLKRKVFPAFSHFLDLGNLTTFAVLIDFVNLQHVFLVVQCFLADILVNVRMTFSLLFTRFPNHRLTSRQNYSTCVATRCTGASDSIA